MVNFYNYCENFWGLPGSLHTDYSLTRSAAPAAWLSGLHARDALMPCTNMDGDMTELQAFLQSEVTPPKIPATNVRRYPLLQDINGDMAYLLSHSTISSSKETMVELSNFATLKDLYEAWSVAFVHATGNIAECDDTYYTTVTKYKLKQRQCAKAKASLALDIVNLFNFLCGSNTNFTMDVLANDRAHVTPRDPKDIIAPCSPLQMMQVVFSVIRSPMTSHHLPSPSTYLVPRCAMPARAPHYLPPHALARRVSLQYWLATSLARCVRQSTLGLPSHPCPSLSKTIQPIPITTPRAAVANNMV